jgi:chromate reductase, NAD(P)H dehydrogenase (quinone)
VTPVKVLGIVGSLREGSFNRFALQNAIDLAPEGVQITAAGIGDIPPYNSDVEAQGRPESVVRLREAIAEADAVLFATPEYNYSIPGVLKNAIDWASRGQDQPFNGKAVAIMGASMGMFGTARAQYHLRQVLVFLNAFPINRPEVMIARAQDKFDAEGKLTDETARKLIVQLLEGLRDWAIKLR